MNLISLRNVTKVYGEGKNRFLALDNVNLDIQSGEFVALMGPSGSGKSTLSNILGTLDVVTLGKYYFRGVDVSSLNLDSRARLRREYFGFIFQGFNLLSKTTALENVELPLLYARVGSKQRKSMSMEALEIVGLSKWANHMGSQLSGGQAQRVAIARAIVAKPLFLIADEPTGNLDSKRSIEIMEILKNLNENLGITIVMVTHEENMADFASRKIKCIDGRLIV